MAAFVGQNTDVDASAEALGGTQAIVYGVTIKAHPDNTGVVYVGLTSGVTAANGFPLAAGESQAFDVIFATDIANIYVIGSAANQVVAYWGA